VDCTAEARPTSDNPSFEISTFLAGVLRGEVEADPVGERIQVV